MMSMNFKRLATRLRESLSWSRLKELRLGYDLAAFFPLYILFSWFFTDWLAGGAFAGLAVAAARELHSRYAQALAARVEANEGPAWDVEVNQVAVGTITDGDYALIRLRVFSDVRVYISQALNVLRVAVNSFDYCYRAVPLGIFWIGIALAVFSPETIGSVVTALRAATAANIKEAVSTASTALAVMMVLSVGLHWAFGVSRFGFINRFGEAIGTAVRKHCGVAAEGSIVLSRWIDGVPVLNDEMAFLRRRVKR
jgi:hypothetical protein